MRKLEICLNDDCQGMAGEPTLMDLRLVSRASHLAYVTAKMELEGTFTARFTWGDGSEQTLKFTARSGIVVDPRLLLPDPT